MMKEYEEFYKKEVFPNPVYKGYYQYVIGKYFWKAALNWALTQTSKSIEEDGTISNSDIIFGREIREELKD